ncbi:MAG: tetratricopeptide repeat protein [Coleofasciculus sp. C1-SOL-03]|jgi:tetratricopeptide (TPR) repeat protein|uniref:tetratricopeptide repeat protein n=1 Tax=Coleofasciculus sp. C1-SOL-03 TaxID=3069522 RepID=UPI0032F60E98
MAKKWQKEYRRIAKAEADRLFDQGTHQYNNSQFRAALQSWQQALTRYREIRDRKGEGYSLGSLGNAYNRLGEYQKAINYFILCVEITQEIGDRKGEGYSLGNLGNAYTYLGEYQKAIDYYQQSLAIFQKIGDRHGEGNSLIGLGNADDSLEEYQRHLWFQLSPHPRYSHPMAS